MPELIASSHNTLIVGLGLTGVSVARYLDREGVRFCVADVKPNIETLQLFKGEFPNISIFVGELNFTDWTGITEIVISPGVPRSHPAILMALENGIPVVGDVELFAQVANAPIVAITGSNGKTTVTTMVGDMARQSNVKVKVGGNIGTPCLDLLSDEAELYVLELSSFQLESVTRLNAKVATVLNLSPDHMDRYPSYQNYHFTKQRIYFGAEKVVASKDDALTQPPLSVSSTLSQFGSSEPDLKDYGLRKVEGQLYLAHGLTSLIAVDELKIVGAHNYLNAVAALAIGSAAGLDDDVMIEALKAFPGLSHRCQFIRSVGGVEYYNDSKATNVGATLAALKGLDKKIILIAGGDGKGADFSGFGANLSGNVKAVVVIGVDGAQIFNACKPYILCFKAETLKSAVLQATKVADEGDAILLSPACASFDMFKNYQDRGQQFIAEVEAL